MYRADFQDLKSDSIRSITKHYVKKQLITESSTHIVKSLEIS